MTYLRINLKTISVNSGPCSQNTLHGMILAAGSVLACNSTRCSDGSVWRPVFRTHSI